MGSIYRSKIEAPTDEAFAFLVANSINYSQITKKLAMVTAGTSHVYVKQRIDRQGLSVEHFRCIRGTIIVKLEQQLVVNSTAARVGLKKKLIKQKLLTETCAECGLNPTWNNKPLVLQLDHINGVSNDNRIENLRLLCPNCHTQTPTFCGKNVPKRTTLKQVEHCVKCFATVSSVDRQCRLCFSKSQTRFEVTKEELAILIWQVPAETLGKRFGVSGKAIEKRCKKFGISKPPRGYWAKQKALSSTS